MYATILALKSVANSAININQSMNKYQKQFLLKANDETGICGDGVNYTFTSSTGELIISGSGSMSQVAWESYKLDILTVDIQYGVTNIMRNAFFNCDNLISATIPKSVTSIEDSAFRYCLKLTTINIPNSVTSIGSFGFSYSGLTTITIPDSIRSIGFYVFHCCYSLTSVTIPDSVTSIEDFAFYRCYRLPSIHLPNSITSIGSFVFESCSKLTSVTFYGKEEPEYGQYIFANAPLQYVFVTRKYLNETFCGIPVKIISHTQSSQYNIKFYPNFLYV